MGKPKTNTNLLMRESLIEMLRYKRPDGSITQQLFCERFIEPLMGLPDMHGNYILTIGDKPRVCFMSHHDTVHRSEGMQRVYVKDGIASVEGPLSSCLGADCTTGVWLMLEMIKAKVSATYVIHAGEEIGCVGSRALVGDMPNFIKHTDFAISLDRKGRDSIITHQLGYRTCSESFSSSLAESLSMGYTSDSTGAYTDSNEYTDHIPECTNISVGYYNQHTSKETQDLDFAISLRWHLINADYTKLVVARSPDDMESYTSIYKKNDYTGFKSRFDFDDPCDWMDSKPIRRYLEEDDSQDWTNYRNKGIKKGSIEDLVEEHPRAIADMLEQMGFTYEQLAQELADGIYG